MKKIEQVQKQEIKKEPKLYCQKCKCPEFFEFKWINNKYIRQCLNCGANHTLRGELMKDEPK